MRVYPVLAYKNNNGCVKKESNTDKTTESSLNFGKYSSETIEKEVSFSGLMRPLRRPSETLARKLSRKTREAHAPWVNHYANVFRIAAMKISKRNEKIVSFLAENSKKITNNLTGETYKFSIKLLERMRLEQFKQRPVKVIKEQVMPLIEKYKKYPDARAIMEKALILKEDGDYRYTLKQIAGAKGIFGAHYSGTQVQNAFINAMMDAKVGDDNFKVFGGTITNQNIAKSFDFAENLPRFMPEGIVTVTKNLTGENANIAEDMLNIRIKTDCQEDVNINILKEVLENPHLSIEDKADEIENLKNSYPFEGFAFDNDCEGFDKILTACKDSNCQILGTLLKHDLYPEDTVYVLNMYEHKMQSKIGFYLEAYNNGDISFEEFSALLHILKNAKS